MATRAQLPSLEIEGYRAIRHLRIAKLGQVNLFVGKNNVGKTSLLEAIRLFASRNAPTVMAQLFSEKFEYRSRFSVLRKDEGELAAEEYEAIAAGAEAFFHGSFSGPASASIRIGLAGLKGDVLEITLPWTGSVRKNRSNQKLLLDHFVAPESPVFEIHRGNETASIPFDVMLRRIPIWPVRNRSRVLMIPATGWGSDQLARMWDIVAESGMAIAVERALRRILPDLERIHVIGESGLPARGIRLALSSASRPVPLSSLGDGINRVFGIALALVQTKGGVLLIDEVENGLHYTVQEEVWRATMSLATELRVQVFATTHSWDCIQAFAIAANDAVEVDGMLHRLEVSGRDTLRTVDMNEEDLSIVTRQRIEVR